MSFDLESKIKPELKEIFSAIERNQEYLREHDILRGEKTLKGDLENFYDLKYHKETHMVATKAALTENVLGTGEENKGKYGSKPNELIKILNEFPIKSEDGENESNFNLLIYEKVRGSFCKSQFPSWKSSLYGGLSAIGICGLVVGPIYSLANLKPEDVSNLAWSISLTLASGSLMVYSPYRQIKDRFEFAQENFSEERENIQNDFWKLHNTAKEMDKFVTQYNSLFEE